MKFYNKRIILCFIFITAHSILEGEELDEADSTFSFQGPLYVSLGGDCLTAGMIRHFGKRQAAFPFDWMLTLDEVGFIELLNNNFQDFINKEYLVKHPVTGAGLVHSLYHMEFAHDWLEAYWQNNSQSQEIEKLQIKFQRRIGRFQQLANYKDLVVFIRTMGHSYKRIDMDPATYWFDYLPDKNEKEFSLNLYDALKKLFPNLDFKLIVVNQTDDQYKIEVFDNITLCYFPKVLEHCNWEQLFKDSQ